MDRRHTIIFHNFHISMKQKYIKIKAVLIKGKSQLIYAGLSSPWYYVWNIIPNNAQTQVHLLNGILMGNGCEKTANVSSYYPAQIAAERVNGLSSIFESFYFDNTAIYGRVAGDDIGIYTWDSDVDIIQPNTSFSTVAAEIIRE